MSNTKTSQTTPLANDPTQLIEGIILVDHGSRRSESNEMLLKVVESYREHSHFSIIEPAHMEISEPTIATAFDRCVARGATRVIVMPYFLLPGKHWHQDIPHLTAQAASKHAGIDTLVTAPLGLHPLMNNVIEARIEHCIKHVAGHVSECEVCQGTGQCQLNRPTNTN